MGNFQGGGNRGGGFRGGNSGGRPSFQKKSFGGDRGGDRENVMHKATCSECGKTCEVPFRPSGDKPVYCSDCFNKKKVGDDRGPRRDFGDRAPRREFNDRPAPRADFARPTPVNNDDTKNQLRDISIRLDKLINAVEKLAYVKSEVPASVKITPSVEVKNKSNPKTIIKKAIKVKTSKAKVVVKKNK